MCLNKYLIFENKLMLSTLYQQFKKVKIVFENTNKKLVLCLELEYLFNKMFKFISEKWKENHHKVQKTKKKKDEISQKKEK